MTTAGLAFETDGTLWRAWSPGEVAEILGGVEAPWYVAGGWALDLFLGEQRREHEDLEIAVSGARFDEVEEALSAYEIHVVTGPGHVTPVDDARAALGHTHQTWVREPATGWWRLDVFREPSDGDEWIYRRDPRIRLRYEDVIERAADGIPYGRPEIVLLFKAKHAREPKHADDFVAVLPQLASAQRRWLADALALVHPGHPWLGQLGAERS